MTFGIFIILLILATLDTTEGGPKLWLKPCERDEGPSTDFNPAISSPNLSKTIQELHLEAYSAQETIEQIIDFYKKNHVADSGMVQMLDDGFKSQLTNSCIYFEPLKQPFLVQNRTSLWATYAVIAKYLHYISFTSELVPDGENLKKGCNKTHPMDCAFGYDSDSKKRYRSSLDRHFQHILCSLKNLANESMIPNRTVKHIKISTRCVRAYVLNTTKGHRECRWLESPVLQNISENLNSTSLEDSVGDLDTSLQGHEEARSRTKRDIFRLKRSNRFGSRLKLNPTQQPGTTAFPNRGSVTTTSRIRHNRGKQERKHRTKRKRQCRKLCRRKDKLSRKERRRHRKCNCEQFKKKRQKKKDFGRKDHNPICKQVLDTLPKSERYFMDYIVLRNILYTLQKIIPATDIMPKMAGQKSRLMMASAGNAPKPLTSLLSTSTFIVSFRHLSDYLSSYFR